MFRKILIRVELLDPFSFSSSSFFFFLLCLYFLPLPGFLTMAAEMERCRETGGERGGEGRRERVPTSTVNDIIGTQPLQCLFSLIQLFASLYRVATLVRLIMFCLIVLIILYYIFCDKYNFSPFPTVVVVVIFFSPLQH